LLSSRCSLRGSSGLRGGVCSSFNHSVSMTYTVHDGSKRRLGSNHRHAEANAPQRGCSGSHESPVSHRFGDAVVIGCPLTQTRLSYSSFFRARFVTLCAVICAESTRHKSSYFATTQKNHTTSTTQSARDSPSDNSLLRPVYRRPIASLGVPEGVRGSSWSNRAWTLPMPGFALNAIFCQPPHGEKRSLARGRRPRVTSSSRSSTNNHDPQDHTVRAPLHGPTSAGRGRKRPTTRQYIEPPAASPAIHSSPPTKN